MTQLFAVLALSTAMLLGPRVAFSKTMLFGGSGHDQYLGCIDCNRFSSDSICNRFGRYGNRFASAGMFNRFAGFGNKFSAKSPWNRFSRSTEVPVLVDEDGNFYGYFTINRFRSDAVDFAPQLRSLYEGSNGDLEQVRVGLCVMFGRRLPTTH